VSGSNQQYWDEYSNLQHTKHRIIREYLNGWFPKLGLRAGRILYLDTHAGKGKHSSGEEGSPLVALRTLLEHRAKKTIMENSKIDFVFIERNETSYKSLKNELDSIEYPKSRINIKIINYDSFEFLNDFCVELNKQNVHMFPCFMFVDPFGFKLRCDLLRQIMQHKKSELLVTIMWRELDMAIMNERKRKSLLKPLNELFGCDDWLSITKNDNSDSRAEMAVHLLRKQIGAKWQTYIKMLDNGRIRYLLLHLTNHDDGRDLIKNVLWNCSPEGGWFARKSDDPKQYRLFKPQPDQTPLRDWLIDKLTNRCYTWNELTELVREEIWLNKHLWDVIREMKNNNQIVATNFTGRFSQKANPTLRLLKH